MSKQAMIGGQAVIEGVFMKNGEQVALAVRKPDGGIDVTSSRQTSVTQNYPFLKVPFIRGTVNLIESLAVGMKALTQSANLSAQSEEEELSPKEMIITMISALFFGIALFVIIPMALTKFLSDLQGAWFSLAEGGIRIVILLVYIMLMSRMKDIKRVFQYHGAEHKTIAAYEAGEELTVDNVRKYSPLHPRCGTSFIMFVMITKIFIFSFISSQIVWVDVTLRVISLPLVAGIAYEFIRLSGKYANRSQIGRLLIAPGLWMQKLTTNEPDDQQIEVAIAATQVALGVPVTVSNVAMATEDIVEEVAYNNV